jgi:hypothetical protein
MNAMRHFLIVLDRPKGRVLREDEFENVADALKERFRTERLYRANPDIEVVVLSAESREALLRTHARYFMTLSELLRRSEPEAL